MVGSLVAEVPVEAERKAVDEAAAVALDEVASSPML